jgi:hypothetical protein
MKKKKYGVFFTASFLPSSWFTRGGTSITSARQKRLTRDSDDKQRGVKSTSGFVKHLNAMLPGNSLREDTPEIFANASKKL